jgi:predicted nucleic acid-binding protein
MPTTRHLDLLEELLGATGVGGNLVTDAHLAALAIEHGADLCTFDNDFDRFPGLATTRPE